MINYIERKECCICHNRELLFKKKIYDHDTNLGYFNLLYCPKCKMFYTSPYPDAQTLPELYVNRNSRNCDPNNSLVFKILKHFFAKKYIKNTLKKCALRNNIVDFGCGDGNFSIAISNVAANSLVTAVDFMKDAPEGLKNKDKIKYITVDNFFNSDNKYDIILLRHVLEHTENPKTFLSELYKHLNKSGSLVVEVPNIDNGLKLWFDKYLPSYAPPYHLVHFTKENITNLMNELGLECVFFKSSMPLMSNIIANITKQKLNNFHRLIGVILYPLQLLLCRNKPEVLYFIIKKK